MRVLLAGLLITKYLNAPSKTAIDSLISAHPARAISKATSIANE